VALVGPSEKTSQSTHKVYENVLVLTTPLPPGDYEWTIEAFDKENQSIAKRRAFKLSIPEKTIEFPFPDIDKVFSRVHSHHPRLIFDKNDLPDIRSTLHSTRKQAWQAVQHMADESLELDTPKPPWYASISKKEDYNTRRLEYRKYYRYIRKYIDEGLQSTSLAWLMTGDEKYADKAKEILFVLIQWDPHGITSSNEIGFDEPGLSLARCVHRAYDWLYDALSDQEREQVRQYVIERTRDTWSRVGENRPFLVRPGSSHDGRLIGYLGEQALVLAGEADEIEVKKWLNYSLKAFWSVFPHWAGSDGGWAEGIGYAAAYNIRASTWIESFLQTADLDLWQKPFFQKIPDFFIYCARPNDEFWAFGDGAERGPRSQPSRAKILRSLMSHYAQRFNYPEAQWWANQVPLESNNISNPITPLIAEQKIEGKPPHNLANAAVFRDIGWVALHSDLADIDKDIFFLFKSSPFGSISHSHADQNAFYLSVGGRALAIPSGYYGPVYGMPHHAEWTRSSKANNTILVDGEGQIVRDFTATGSISKFFHHDKITYFCGDAAPAYKGTLNKFDRHVLYIRPGFFLILDDLQTPEPQTFQWMLHALKEMHIEHNIVTINRLGARAQFTLFTSANQSLKFSQTDKFDTPFHAGTDSSFETTVKDHWHLSVETPSTKNNKRIAAFVNVGLDSLPKVVFKNLKGWQKALLPTPNGIAEIWAQVEPNALVPKALSGLLAENQKDALLVGVWRPNDAKIQIVTNLD